MIFEYKIYNDIRCSIELKHVHRWVNSNIETENLLDFLRAKIQKLKEISKGIGKIMDNRFIELWTQVLENTLQPAKYMWKTILEGIIFIGDTLHNPYGSTFTRKISAQHMQNV